MNDSTLYTDSYEIKEKLHYFGCCIEDLQDVALAAVSARNEATPLHPATAPGTFSYMAGVAALRVAFLPIEGWEMDREKGVETVKNNASGLVVLFQNVDVACGLHDPSPISSKGDAITSMVDNASGYLWPHMEVEDKTKENSSVWFFCVSNKGDELRAELSRPRAIENGNFGTFAERIFITQDWSPLSGGTDDQQSDSSDDFDIHVSKKN